MQHGKEAVITRLRALGLSTAGVLGSTGVRQHAERLGRGDVTSATLARYADAMATVVDIAGGAIPVDFWDVQSPMMRATGLTEYALVGELAQPLHAGYVRLLGQAYARFCDFRQHSAVDTALATACDLLRLSVAAVRAGIALPVLAGVPHFSPTDQALFVWQQLVCGTTRWVPIVRRPLFPHSVWSRLNVATMWQYHLRRGMSVARVWGVAGFHPDYVGVPHNSNQVEHLTISAVVQSAYHVPTVVLDLVEVAEAVLTPAISVAERDADIALNRVVARELLPHFTLANADAAVDHLHLVLAAPALRWLPVPRKPRVVLLASGLVSAAVLGGLVVQRGRRVRD